MSGLLSHDSYHVVLRLGKWFVLHVLKVIVPCSLDDSIRGDLPDYVGYSQIIQCSDVIGGKGNLFVSPLTHDTYFSVQSLCCFNLYNENEGFLSNIGKWSSNNIVYRGSLVTSAPVVCYVSKNKVYTVIIMTLEPWRGWFGRTHVDVCPF